MIMFDATLYACHELNPCAPSTEGCLNCIIGKHYIRRNNPTTKNRWKLEGKLKSEEATDNAM